MKVLDGKKIAQNIKGEIARKLEKLQPPPSLHVITVGKNKISDIFFSQKEKACKEVGISFYCHRLRETAPNEEISQLIKNLNLDQRVTGILIQLPLPPRLGSGPNLCGQISPKKDVDCLTPVNFGRFAQGFPLFIPPTAQAIDEILKEEGLRIKGARVVVIGAGRIAGLPIALSLLKQGATVTICHEFTKNLILSTKTADLLISATGHPHLIKGPMVKKGAVVIDVGTSVIGGKTTGDVESKSLEGIASKVAPVPGGVGPITVACLLRNVVLAGKIQRL